MTPHLLIARSGVAFSLNPLGVEVEIVVVKGYLELLVGAVAYGLNLCPIGEITINGDESFRFGLVPLGSAVLGYKANLLYGSIVVDVINAVSGSGKVLTVVDDVDSSTRPNPCPCGT